MMWMILQAEQADAWVIATGLTTHVHDFVKMVFQETGYEIDFIGEGVDKKGYLVSIYEKIYAERVGEQHLVAIKQT